MLCALALDDALPPRGADVLEVRHTLSLPWRYWKLSRARKHRAAAKRLLDQLHARLHDRASLGVANAELWTAIMRGVDALALSRWLGQPALAPEDVRPARATVHIMLGDISELLGQLHELEWPSEAPDAAPSGPRPLTTS
jgi:hypothetical protein